MRNGWGQDLRLIRGFLSQTLHDFGQRVLDDRELERSQRLQSTPSSRDECFAVSDKIGIELSLVEFINPQPGETLEIGPLRLP